MNTDSGGGTTTTQGPKWLLPYQQRGAEQAGSVYDNEMGGQNIAPISQDTTDAWDLAGQRARAGSGPVIAAQRLNQKTLEGGFLGSNPYLDQAFNRAALQTQNQLSSEFARAGRNVEASEGLRSQQLNDLATGIYGGAYDSERNRQQDAMGMAIPLANQDYVDIGQLQQVGAGREGYSQEQLDAPGIALDRFLGRINGVPAQSTYASQNRNRAAGALGGGMLGYQAGSSLGSSAGGNSNLWGALGALGGLYAGGWG